MTTEEIRLAAVGLCRLGNTAHPGVKGMRIRLSRACECVKDRHVIHRPNYLHVTLSPVQRLS